MNAINLDVARHLVVSGAVSAAAIECINGKKWAITFLGQIRYVLKSERQSPRLYGALETAIAEIQQLGLKCCEVHFEQWTGKRTRRLRAGTESNVGSKSGVRQ